MLVRVVLIPERRAAHPGMRLELDAEAMAHLGSPPYVRLTRRDGHIEVLPTSVPEYGDAAPVRTLVRFRRQGRVSIGRLAQRLGLPYRAGPLATTAAPGRLMVG